MKVFSSRVSLALALSLFVNTTVPQNVHATTMKDYQMEISTHEKKISDVFNKFRYDMTVEWDQQDPYFKENAQKELETSLSQLQKEGVTTEQILSHMQNSLLDAKTSKEYGQLVAALKKQNLHEEEASSAAMKFMEKSYSQGANFHGGGSGSYKKVAIVIGIVIVGVVTYFVIKHYKKKSGSDSSDSSDSTDSTSSTGGEDCPDGHDGRDGHDGWDGRDGHDGWDGRDGHDGWDGRDGHDGYDGHEGWNN